MDRKTDGKTDGHMTKTDGQIGGRNAGRKHGCRRPSEEQRPGTREKYFLKFYRHTSVPKSEMQFTVLKTDGLFDGRTDERTEFDGQTDKRIDKRTDGRTDEQTDGRSDGRTDGRMISQADRGEINVRRWTVDQEVVGSNPTHGRN